ncbi:other/SCY1 protein kinase [Ephemerocybe angulata]|uniref:Other/SCY1 protein kinase n=1 Tax=Ephemerocybe angulata TaxID=980116 RepID=A0A8H6MG18_9AGAR|nr:other/SCY1 protein kinase [Tulosesus angulatus]
MAHLLASANSFFGRTAISQSYSIGNPSQTSSRPATPGQTGSGSASGIAPLPFTPSFFIGLWKLQPAAHKTTGKRVSVWSFDKRGPDMERLGPAAKERTIEVLKLEATSLSRLRHPSILEMVEPLEETRTELVFATEPVLSSLEHAIPGSGRHASLVELDEVEIQKGILQLCKGLSFLHNSAKLIHSNICPESIMINAAGDWKISGLGLTIPLLTNGNPTRWEFPTFDGRVPSYIQRSFDYMAPEYALDEQLLTASDMYSLGCVLYAVHSKGATPYKNHGSLGGLRENAGKPITGIERLEPDLQSLLRSLITREGTSRPTPSTLPSHPFFSSLPISTLNFLDRSNFTAKTREEKISFMKGLTGVMNRFSEGLQTRKILPSLLEEMKDTNLLPYILPNVFVISQALAPTQFASLVLPSLKPLFSIKEPPQNMLTLLDNLSMLQSKTEKLVFKDHVLPLVYNALESEHPIVQERALNTIPDLCESVDYAEIQGVLFPKVCTLSKSTRILSVKVGTLKTFLSMVKTLDKLVLTQKLVPLLSGIRTKEPAVMMMTLSVQEAMGMKVDREAVATLILPQLWAMSMGPLLNVTQFQHFMSVIKKLAERVEREHNQFLRDSQRIEDMSATRQQGNGSAPPAPVAADFETLVNQSNASTGSSTSAPVVTATNTGGSSMSWDDDVWGSLDKPASPPQNNGNTSSSTHNPSNSFSSPPLAPPTRQSAFQPKPSKLGASASAASTSISNSFNRATNSLATTIRQNSSSAAISLPMTPATNAPFKPNYNISLSATSPMVATPPPAPLNAFNTSPAQPNYSAHIPTQPVTNGFPASPPAFSQPPPSFFSTPMAPTASPPPPPMMGGGLLMPSKPPQPQWGGSQKQLTAADLGDFDPLA